MTGMSGAKFCPNCGAAVDRGNLAKQVEKEFRA